jgi:hypothetical protein
MSLHLNNKKSHPLAVLGVVQVTLPTEVANHNILYN